MATTTITSLDIKKGTTFTYWCEFENKQIKETFLEVTENGVMMESFATYDIDFVLTMKIKTGSVEVLTKTTMKPNIKIECASVFASAFDLPYSDFKKLKTK